MIKKSIIFFLILISIINIVSAETGTLTAIQHQQSNNYKTEGGTPTATNNWTQFQFYNTGFNYISYLKLYSASGYVTFNLESEISTFDIIYGGIGNGYAVYSKNAKTLEYFFNGDNGAYITNKNFTIRYNNENFSNNMTATTHGGCFEVDSTHPVYQGTTGYYAPCGDGLRIQNSPFSIVTAKVTQIVTNDYNIVYNASYFITTINKSSTVNTSINIVDVYRTSYFSESSYNLNSFTTINLYGNGIGIYMNTTTGNNDFKIINTSGIDDYSIVFNKTQYNLNDNVLLNVNISGFDSNSNYILKFYQEKIGYDVTETIYPLINSSMVIIPSIDKTKISFIYANIFKNNVYKYSSISIPYGMNENITNITGNITLDKTQYSLGENINIKYNISVSGRIIVQCQNILYSENVYSGINQQTNYTLSKLQLFPCQIKLQYYYTQINDWVTIDYKIFESIEGIDNIFFSKDYVSLGETINVYYNTMGDRYIVLKDSQNNIKFNYTVPLSQYGLFKQYTLVSTDITGNYTAFLNYTNDTTIMTANIKVMDAIVLTPTKTTNVTYSLFDLFSDGSKAIVGDIDLDNNGDISDNEIKKKGDKAYYIFIFLALIILVSGTWNKLIRRK